MSSCKSGRTRAPHRPCPEHSWAKSSETMMGGVKRDTIILQSPFWKTCPHLLWPFFVTSVPPREGVSTVGANPLGEKERIHFLPCGLRDVLVKPQFL